MFVNNQEAAKDVPFAKPIPDAAEILKTLKTPDGVIELRVINRNPKRVDAGYFDNDHQRELIDAAIESSKEGANV